jgi:hypothetical protein
MLGQQLNLQLLQQHQLLNILVNLKKEILGYEKIMDQSNNEDNACDGKLQI